MAGDSSCRTLESDLLKLLNNRELSNVSFLCKDGVIYAVKELLAARSDFFETLLYGGLRETAQEQIQLPTALSSHLLTVFQFLHSGKLYLPANPAPELVIGVYELSRQYQLADLQEKLRKTIPGLLSNANVGPFLELAKEVGHCPAASVKILYCAPDFDWNTIVLHTDICSRSRKACDQVLFEDASDHGHVCPLQPGSPDQVLGMWSPHVTFISMHLLDHLA